MDDEISIQLFCHSLDSWLRLLLRSVKVLLEFGLSGHAVGEADLVMDQMVLFFFCEFSESLLC